MMCVLIAYYHHIIIKIVVVVGLFIIGHCWSLVI